MGRDHHPVPGPDHFHRGTSLLDHAERLVPENQPGLGPGPAVVHVQVGAADSAGGHPEHDVGGFLQDRVGHLAYLDAAGTGEYHRLHDEASFGNPAPVSSAHAASRWSCTDRLDAAGWDGRGRWW